MSGIIYFCFLHKENFYKWKYRLEAYYIELIKWFIYTKELYKKYINAIER